jgi:hypothetical protein
MEIQTEFVDAYTNKIYKLLNHSNNQKIIIHGFIALTSLLAIEFVVSFFLK